MFASQVKKQVTVGSGPDAIVVTIRKLSARSLDKAREQRQITGAETIARFGPDMVKAFREAARDRTPEQIRSAAEAPDARYGEFDRDLVLTQGIESWTASVPLKDGLADLDEETAEFLFHEIVDLSAPPKAVVEEAAKNA